VKRTKTEAIGIWNKNQQAKLNEFGIDDYSMPFSFNLQKNKKDAGKRK
jgi:hypothetical protein